MSIAERAMPVPHLSLEELQGIRRPYSQEGITLGLNGRRLAIDIFVLSFRELEIDRELGMERQIGIARDVRMPITLVKRDGTVRTFGFTPLHCKGIFISEKYIGFRPSRPVIFVGTEYKMKFEGDNESSLSFGLESTRPIEPEVVPENVSNEEVLSRIARARQYIDVPQARSLTQPAYVSKI